MDYENENVHQVYEKIAMHFSMTRHTVWKYTKKFISSLDKDGDCLEIGCGNGKNMLFRKDLNWKGVEVCQNFKKICIERGLDVVIGNAINLPFEDNSFDTIISIAVIHHLSTKERRLKAIQETLRVAKVGARLLLEVWSITQNLKSKHKFIKQENLVSWEEKDTEEIHYRYYHVFIEKELHDLVLEAAKGMGIKLKLVMLWEMGNDIADITIISKN